MCAQSKSARIITESIYPTRIVETIGSITDANLLLHKKVLQISLNEKDTTRVMGKCSILLDFGRELSGGVRILTGGATFSVPVRIRFGESVTEASVSVGESGATNDHSPRDFEAVLPALSDLVLGRTGFRFVRIDFPEGCELCIKAIVAEFTHIDLPYGDNFRCSDERLNEIYKIACYTVWLNLQNDRLWDGIKRDRLVWIGDMHPETKALLCMYGDLKNVELALDFSRDTTPLPNWVNTIPAYTLWWGIIQYDYYRYTGKLDYLKENLPYMRGTLDLVASQFCDDGKLIYAGADGSSENDFFLDWPSNHCPGVNESGFALTRIYLNSLEGAFTALGEDTAKIKQLQAKLRKSAYEGPLKQLTAIGALAGDTDSKTAAEDLCKGGAKGLSTFMSYYILRAMAEGGKMSEALRILKEYYGAMIDRGATSFWEDFSMDWLEGSGRIDAFPAPGEKDIHGDYGAYCYTGFRHSLCHGWSAGPVPFLTEYVLGIRVEEAGCKTLRISPNLGEMDFAEGRFPTPYGDVTVRHERTATGVKTVYDAPKEIKIILS